MKNFLFAIGCVVMLFFIGCKSNAYETLKIEHQWGIPTFTVNFIEGLYNNQIYTLTMQKGVGYDLSFYSLSGIVQKKIHFKIGQGPSEFKTTPSALAINDDGIFVFFYSLNIIKKFNPTGIYIDEYLINKEREFNPFFPEIQLNKETIYYHNIGNDYLGISTIEGKVTERLPYSVEIDPTRKKWLYQGGMLKYDTYTNQLYVGRYAAPLTIEIYNDRLSLMGEIRDKQIKAKELFIVTSGKYSNPEGDFVLNDIDYDEDYIYVITGVSLDWNKDASPKEMSTTNCIMSYDKLKKKFFKKYWNPNLKPNNFGYFIVGITSDYIVVSSMGAQENSNNKETFYVLKK